MIKVKVKKLDPEAKLPTSAHIGEDVGYDVYALEDVIIPYGSTREIRTGIAIEPPEGYYCTIATRSGYGRSGKFVHPGVIDPGFRGEITIHLHNISTNTMVRNSLEIEKGDKVAQLLFHKAQYVDFVEVDELTASERGEKGYGSSGR